MELSNWIREQANTNPTKTAIVFEQHVICYSGLADQIDDYAHILATAVSVQKGDRVAYLGFNSVEFIALLFACARIGAIVVPLNWRLAATEHVQLLKISNPVALIVENNFLQHIDQVAEELKSIKLLCVGKAEANGTSFSELVTNAERQPDPTPQKPISPEDGLLLCFTSGTTGIPKGALLSQKSVMTNALNAVHMHDLTEEDITLTILPMFHVGGLNIQTLPTLFVGGTVILPPRFEIDQFYEAFKNYPITLTLVVPTVMYALMNDKRWNSFHPEKLKIIAIGSSIVPESLVSSICEWGVPMIQVYGSTETCPIAAYTPVTEAHRKPASTGKTALHCEIKLVDEHGNKVPQDCKGEILVRGENVMSSYWQDPQTTNEVFTKNWFHTGDVGHFDKDNFLYVDGRIKEIIISGGENLYPAAIENVLVKHPDIIEIVVAGKPDDYWGEICVAVIVTRKNTRVDLEMIKDFCNDKIAHSSIPKELIVVDELPRNSMGKVIKKSIAELIEVN